MKVWILMMMLLMIGCSERYKNLDCDSGEECTLRIVEVTSARTFKDNNGNEFVIKNREAVVDDEEREREQIACLEERIEGQTIRVRRYGYWNKLIQVRVLSHRVTC